MDFDRVEVGGPFEVTPFTVERIGLVGDQSIDTRFTPNVTHVPSMPWRSVLTQLRAARVRIAVLRAPCLLEVLAHSLLPETVKVHGQDSVEVARLLRSSGYKVTCHGEEVEGILDTQVSYTVLPKVYILTRTEWALGVISRGILSMNLEFDVRILGWEEAYKWWEIIQNTAYDLLVVHTISVYGTIMQMGGIPAVPVCHGPIELQPEWYASRGGITMLKPGMLVGCVSKDLVSDVCAHGVLGVHTPCGIDPSIYLPGSRGPSTELRVLYPRPDEQDDCHRGTKRIDLVRRLQHSFASHARIRIRFLEHCVSMSDMVDEYQRSDVILILSVSEGNPLPVLEGAACGCTVVTTSVGIVPDLVDASSGIVVGGGSDEKILEEAESALRYLDENRDALESMQRALRDRVMSGWTWGSHTAPWNSFLYKAIEIERRKKSRLLHEQPS